MLRRSIQLVAVASVAALAGCSDDPPVQQIEDVDAGGLQCGVGQVARWGQCYCQTDAACPEGQQCEEVTGLCVAKPATPDGGEPTPKCTSGAVRCKPDLSAVERCVAGEWVVDTTCAPPNGYCAASATGFYCTVCKAGEMRCKDASTIEICSEKGDRWEASACKDPVSGAAVQCVNNTCQVCAPNSTRCSTDGKYLETCAADGMSWSAQYCRYTGQCSAAGGPAHCVDPACVPGTRRCNADGLTLETCKADGTGWASASCKKGAATPPVDEFATEAGVCRNNECFDPCAQAARESSYQGCEYWAAVTTNSQLDARFKGGAKDGTQPDGTSQFAIVVSNPHPTAVKVKVWRMKGSEQTSPTDTTPAADASGYITVAAGQIQVIKLPWQSVFATGKAAYAYRLVADLPVSAYQFNPVVASIPPSTQDDYTYTNDASLLLPSHILGPSYVVLGQEHLSIDFSQDLGCTSDDHCPPGPPYNRCVSSIPGFPGTCQSRSIPMPAFFTVVGVENNTKVTIKFSAPTVASKDGAITKNAKDAVREYVLNRYDVLQFWTDKDPTPAVRCTDWEQDPVNADVCQWASDPTGTIILAADAADATKPKPVAVFSGADCTYKPYNKAACDHIEEMMVPFSSWGKNYVGVKSVPYKTSPTSPPPNPPPSPDYWRVVAGCGVNDCPGGTIVTITPPPSSVSHPQYQTAPGVFTLPPIDPNGANFTAPWMEFTQSGHFTVVSSKPAMVSQYFVGENASNVGSINVIQGDPSLILTAPVEQWRRSYNVLTSPTMADNYISLVAKTMNPNGINLKVDGLPINSVNFPGFTNFEPISGTPYVVWRVRVSGGAHQITSDARIGVSVYGYDRYVSYGYTGGLDLVKITSIIPGG